MPCVSSGVEVLEVLDGRLGADGRVSERLVADLRLPVEPAHGPLLRQLQVQQDSDVLARVVLQEQELLDASALAEDAAPVPSLERPGVQDDLPGGALEVEPQAADGAHDRVLLGGTFEEARGAARHVAAVEGPGVVETRRRRGYCGSVNHITALAITVTSHTSHHRQIDKEVTNRLY